LAQAAHLKLCAHPSPERAAGIRWRGANALGRRSPGQTAQLSSSGSRLEGSASDSALPCSVCRDDEFSLLRSSDGFDRAAQRSTSEGSFSLEWQVPRAPVRFPLRDALMSFQDPRSISVQEAGAGASISESSKGPLRVKMTEKAKMYKYLSHRKRYDMDPPPLGEYHASPMPRPPPGVTQRRPAKKVLATFGTESRAQARRDAEDAGWSTWMPKTVEVKDPAQDQQTTNQAIRATLTSSARTVLSHSRRFAAESAPHESTHGSTHGSTHAKKPSSDPLISWSPMRQSRGLPRPVKEWICKGLEFTDAGLGIGDRFDTVVENLAKRAPGHIYNSQDFGNIARWRSEASLPTKQPVAPFTSAETHKMGARRDTTTKRDRQMPGPGYYERMGFAQELMYNLSKRPKGEAPRPLSPPASSKGSRVLKGEMRGASAG